MHTINRRSNFSRSQTTHSVGGPVPIDGDKPIRSYSASSSSSMLSNSSIGPLPNVICVQSSTSSSIVSHSVDSGLQMRDNVKSHINDYNDDDDDDGGGGGGGGGDKKSIISFAAFLDCCDDSVEVDTKLLCRRHVGHIINVSTNATTSFIRKSASCECVSAKRSHNNVDELHIELNRNSSPRDIVATFSRVNEFIGRARELNSKVLIYTSKDRKSLGIVLGIEFLMWYYKIDIDRAIHHWQRNNRQCYRTSISSSSSSPPPPLPDNCMEALRTWARKQIADDADRNADNDDDDDYDDGSGGGGVVENDNNDDDDDDDDGDDDDDDDVDDWRQRGRSSSSRGSNELRRRRFDFGSRRQRSEDSKMRWQNRIHAFISGHLNPR